MSLPEPRARAALCGFPLDAVTRAETVDRAMALAEGGRGGVLMTVNLDILRQMTRDPFLARFARDADCCVADGMPLVWAARLQGRPLPERVCGSDLVWDLPAAAAGHGVRVLFLGGNPGVAERAAAILRDRHPGLAITSHCPPFGFEDDPAAYDRIRDALREADPGLVLVALGCPRQERLIARLASEFPRVCWLGCGYAFSFVAGEQARAPRIWQRLGLEWLHRLASEPGRLWRRYLVHDIPFALRLFADALRQRVKPGAAA